jgi:hypothetical protein
MRLKALSISDTDDRNSTELPSDRSQQCRAVEAQNRAIGDYDRSRVEPAPSEFGAGHIQEARTNKYGIPAVSQIDVYSLQYRKLEPRIPHITRITRIQKI